MANEAYRAVFLRVHPTGKMVLSLTTASDGKEAQYARLVADELGVPALDVKVVPADTDRFGEGRGYNTSPSGGTPAAVGTTAVKIRAKAQLLAGAALETDPGEAQVGGTGPGSPSRAASRRRSRRSRTSRSMPTAPAPCRRGSRAGSTPRPSTATEPYRSGIRYLDIESFTTAQSRLSRTAAT